MTMIMLKNSIESRCIYNSAQRNRSVFKILLIVSDNDVLYIQFNRQRVGIYTENYFATRIKELHRSIVVQTLPEHVKVDLEVVQQHRRCLKHYNQSLIAY